MIPLRGRDLAVKFFISSDMEQLEKDINEWLERGGDLDVVNMLMVSSGEQPEDMAYITVSVWYRLG